MDAVKVLNNAENGLFIVPMKFAKFHDTKINPEVNKEIELSILTQFEKVSFKKVNNELQIAESKNYIFHKYTEDLKDEIIWVDKK
jgi:hypothetical protein